MSQHVLTIDAGWAFAVVCCLCAIAYLLGSDR